MANKSFVFRFDDVEVREHEFSLVKAGEVLTVEPKAFRTLLFLLRNPQRLISKEELLNAVWGDTAVGDGSLTRSIFLLRRLLGDDTREPRYIETVATVGYRFVCKVEVSGDDSGNGGELGGPNDPRSGDVIVANRNWGAISAIAEPETQMQIVTQGGPVPAIASGSGVGNSCGGWLFLLLFPLASPLRSGICAVRCPHRTYRTLSKSPTMAARKTLPE